MANFISTADGAAVVDGGSTAINDDDDKAMFAAMRAVPDFIVVGAGTVRAEDYRPVALDDERGEARLAAGREASPHLAIVTRSLDLEPDMPRLRRPGSPPDHPDRRRRARRPLRRALGGRRCGASPRNGAPRRSLRYLRLAKVVLCEGGPSLMGDFVAAGLVDELALTVAPLLVAGRSPRIAHGSEPAAPLEMELDRVLYGDRSLFLRYSAPSSAG